MYYVHNMYSMFCVNWFNFDFLRYFRNQFVFGCPNISIVQYNMDAKISSETLNFTRLIKVHFIYYLALSISLQCIGFINKWYFLMLCHVLPILVWICPNAVMWIFIDLNGYTSTLIIFLRYKQWWSTIPPLSTKRTITFHINLNYIMFASSFIAILHVPYYQQISAISVFI